MRIHPLGERVLVQVREQSTVSAGGVHLPTLDKNKEPVEYGYVVAQGPEVQSNMVDELVLFHRHAGVFVTIDDVKHQLLLVTSVLGVVDEEHPTTDEGEPLVEGAEWDHGDHPDVDQ